MGGKYQMVTRSRRSERNKYMCAIDAVVGYVMGAVTALLFSDDRINDTGKGK